MTGTESVGEHLGCTPASAPQAMLRPIEVLGLPGDGHALLAGLLPEAGDAPGLGRRGVTSSGPSGTSGDDTLPTIRISSRSTTTVGGALEPGVGETTGQPAGQTLDRGLLVGRHPPAGRPGRPRVRRPLLCCLLHVVPPASDYILTLLHILQIVAAFESAR